jgi:hypothetical protein
MKALGARSYGNRWIDALTPSFIHIAGCGHTGSSIVARVIGEHSLIYFVPMESGMLLANRYFKEDRLRKDFVERALQEGARYVLEKTPRHVWHVDYVRRKSPNTRFFITTRDGREVIASLYRRTQDFRGSCIRYMDDSVMSLRQLDMEDTRLIRLEDFTRDPQTALVDLYSWLGLRHEKNVLDYHKRPVRWNMVSQANIHDLPNAHDIKRNRQVNAKLEQSITRWQERLPIRFHERLLEMFAPGGDGNKIMKAFGYEI